MDRGCSKREAKKKQEQMAQVRQKRKEPQKRTENHGGNFAIFDQRQTTVVKDTTDDYKLLKVIGEGTYGVVYRAVDIRCNRAVAIKQMAVDPDAQGLPSVALREITLLGELHHRNIIALLDVVVSEKYLTVILEHLDMDLREFQTQQIHKHKAMSFDLIRIFQGLAYVHSNRIIHRDIKPQNVLVDVKNSIVKIGDFGLARVFTTPLREMTNEVVTLWYRAPELLMGADVYTTSTDIWSLGVMLIELIENDPPFDPDCEIVAIHMIFRNLGTPKLNAWPDFANHRHYCESFPKWSPKPWDEMVPNATPEALNLLSRMLVYSPEDRITCEEAMAHKMFNTEFGGNIRALYAEPLSTPLSPVSPWA